MEKIKIVKKTINKENQEHSEIMRNIRPAYSNSSEEYGSQEHSVIMDAILGRGNY